jgi:hypothetical protein
MESMHIMPCSLKEIESEALVDGLLVAKPFDFYKQFSSNTLKYFMYINGFYILPTTELIEWVQDHIIGSAIEIGAGNGCLGRSLNIARTDSYLQADPIMQQLYALVNQPTIKYPEDVERLDYLQAIDKYKPTTVIGSYITHKYVNFEIGGNAYGVREEDILQKATRYINIGNIGVKAHYQKPLLKLPHETFQPKWFIARAADQALNRIWVWTTKPKS